MYIEQYHYNLEFDPVSYFSGFVPGVDYEPTWPIICVSTTRLKVSSLFTFWENILKGQKRTKPSLLLESAVESVHAAINRTLGMKGMAFSMLSACTSGAYALQQAGILSQSCGTPVIVATADNIVGSPHDVHYFGSLGALSLDTGIPFDANSKGFRPGVGQAFFVVSARPISPKAHVNTMRFFTQSNEHTAVGSIEQIQREMFNGIDLSNVSWWNAHAPGTPMGDRAEYTLFDNTCKDVVISSLKGRTGHILASSYLVELGHALDGVRSGVAIGNKGIVTPINNDPRIIQQDTPINTKSFVKFNMGFGGRNVLSLIDVY